MKGVGMVGLDGQDFLVARRCLIELTCLMVAKP
jgi:hypothetical protein